MIAYEEQLNRDFDWALREGGLYFQCRSAVHKTLQRLDKILVDIHVDYAVIGTMAMFYHGYRRFTESIDLVVTPSGLSQFLEVAHRVGFTDPVKDRIVRGFGKRSQSGVFSERRRTADSRSWTTTDSLPKYDQRNYKRHQRGFPASSNRTVFGFWSSISPPWRFGMRTRTGQAPQVSSRVCRAIEP
jgi:hypothetical protein